MKEILEILSAPTPHWVGDGFPVRSLLMMNSRAEIAKAIADFNSGRFGRLSA